MSVDLEQLANRHDWSDEEARARHGICEIGKLCYTRNLISGAEGNISCRLRDDSLIITPPGAMKGFLNPEHLAHYNGE